MVMTGNDEEILDVLTNGFTVCLHVKHVITELRSVFLCGAVSMSLVIAMRRTMQVLFFCRTPSLKDRGDPAHSAVMHRIDARTYGVGAVFPDATLDGPNGSDMAPLGGHRPGGFILSSRLAD